MPCLCLPDHFAASFPFLGAHKSLAASLPSRTEHKSLTGAGVPSMRAPWGLSHVMTLTVGTALDPRGDRITGWISRAGRTMLTAPWGLSHVMTGRIIRAGMPGQSEDQWRARSA